MMAHVVLFAVLWVFYFFGSELPLFASLGKIWVGQETYKFLHDAITANETENVTASTFGGAVVKYDAN